MNFYRVLRDNKELGPYSLDELRKIGLRSSDLVWVDGQSAAWRFPDEISGLLTLIENQNAKSEDTEQAQNSFINKPKKRYRLTADHRMVEITEEEAKSSDIPRISEQPPAPKNEVSSNFTEPSTEEKNDIVPFEDLPFSRKKEAEDTSFPLEPELSNKNSDLVAFEKESFKQEPFSKKEAATQDTFPLEPELDAQKRSSSQPVEEFVDADPNNDSEMKENNHSSNNSGAFILAGLLFLVAISFFGYKWYEDQKNPASNILTEQDSTSKSQDSTASQPTNRFDNSRAIAMNDDTLGQHQRLQERRITDSLKKAEIAKAKLAARQKAKADSIQNAMAEANGDNTETENKETKNPPLTKTGSDTAKAKKVNKIHTSEEIGKYVRVGVVQPKSQNNGVNGVKLVVHNINNRNLAKVHINVLYFDNNGKVIKKSDIIAPNISVGKSVTVPVSDNSNAAYVSYKVTGLLGDHVNLQAKQ